MDPDQNYREQLDLAEELEELLSKFSTTPANGVLQRYEEVVAKAEELSERVVALRDWIAKGGFAPDLGKIVRNR